MRDLFILKLGSNLQTMLFENITPQMTHALSKQIDLLIRNFEPRVKTNGSNKCTTFYRKKWI